jgi:hypothetical protein
VAPPRRRLGTWAIAAAALCAIVLAGVLVHRKTETPGRTANAGIHAPRDASRATSATRPSTYSMRLDVERPGIVPASAGAATRPVKRPALAKPARRATPRGIDRRSKPDASAPAREEARPDEKPPQPAQRAPKKKLGIDVVD